MSLFREQEAKKQWCPLARTVYTNTAGNSSRARNRWVEEADEGSEDFTTYAAGLAGCHCIGSECMAWRWHKTHAKFSDLSDEDKRTARTDRPAPDNRDEVVVAWRTYGFCGAFGPPHVEPEKNKDH